MTIKAILSVDDGKTLLLDCKLQFKPSVGDEFAYWMDFEDTKIPLLARAIKVRHHMVRDDEFHVSIDAITVDDD